MNREEILNYNKRCAEFLEYEFDELSETYETSHLKLVEPQAFGDEQFSFKLKIYELDFHSDWNWIMEVVEAIEKLTNQDSYRWQVLIQNNLCVIEDNNKIFNSKLLKTIKDYLFIIIRQN